MFRRVLLALLLPATAAGGSALNLPKGLPKLPTAVALSPESALHVSATLSTYRELDWQTCCQGEDPFRARGVPPSFNPALQMPNPDPAWIRVWSADTFGSSDLARATLVQAAINRTWTARCHEDYATWRAAWDPVRDQVRQNLERVRGDEPYTRIGFIVDEMVRINAWARAEGLDLPRSHPTYWSGPRHEILEELVAAHREHGKEHALPSLLGPALDDLSTGAALGYAWTDDAAFERDVFCHLAEEHGTHRTPPLPSVEGVAPDPKWVGWPVTGERMRELEAELARLRAPSAAALAYRAPRLPSYELGEKTFDPEYPGVYLVHDRDMRLEQVERHGEGFVAVLGKTVTKPRYYDCRLTDRIESFDLHGNPRYAEECRVGTNERVTTYRVALDLPAWIATKLEPGDNLSLAARVVSEREEIAVDTPSEHRSHARTELEAVHVYQVLRGDRAIVQF